MSTADLPATAHLPFDSKRELLARLARELLAGRVGPISVADSNGELVVYSVPDDARAKAETALRNVSASEAAELRRRSNALEDSFSFEEALSLPPSEAEGSDRSR